MAKRKKTTKAQAIRDYHAEHPDEGPTAVTEALKKLGYTVSPQQVSTTLSNSRRKKRAGGRRRRKARAASSNGRRKSAATAGINVDQIKQAAELVRACGGADAALEAVRAAEDIAGALNAR